MEAKVCFRCKGTKGPMLVHTKYTRKDGTVSRYFLCRECNAKYHREHKKKRGTEYTRKYLQRTYEKHKEKRIAREKARHAVKAGKIIKPEQCEVCKLKKPIQGHHEDYSKPLEVIWLCSGCHAEIHKKIGNGYGRLKEQPPT